MKFGSLRFLAAERSTAMSKDSSRMKRVPHSIQAIMDVICKADIQQAFDWWAENRSVDQAAEWYERIFDAIDT